MSYRYWKKLEDDMPGLDRPVEVRLLGLSKYSAKLVMNPGGSKVEFQTLHEGLVIPVRDIMAWKYLLEEYGD